MTLNQLTKKDVGVGIYLNTHRLFPNLEPRSMGVLMVLKYTKLHTNKQQNLKTQNLNILTSRENLLFKETSTSFVGNAQRLFK